MGSYGLAATGASWLIYAILGGTALIGGALAKIKGRRR